VIARRFPQPLWAIEARKLSHGEGSIEAFETALKEAERMAPKRGRGRPSKDEAKLKEARAARDVAYAEYVERLKYTYAKFSALTKPALTPEPVEFSLRLADDFAELSESLKIPEEMIVGALKRQTSEPRRVEAAERHLAWSLAFALKEERRQTRRQRIPKSESYQFIRHYTPAAASLFGAPPGRLSEERIYDLAVKTGRIKPRIRKRKSQ
jgi:hypothetical protein